MHYELTLYDFFLHNKPVETSIEELAHIWHCSLRYAKTIVKKLHEQHIIKWEVVKGRGKKPILTLLLSKEDCIIKIFNSYWDKSKFEEAYSFLVSLQMLQHPKVQQWLEQQYGVHQNEKLQHILRLPFNNQHITLHPLQALTNWDAHLIKQIHEPLFKENEASGDIEANVLFDYETNDYQTWRFILRKNVYFHHLKPMRAEDIQFSLEQVANLAKPYFQYEKFEIVDDHEIKFTLSKPFVILPELLSSFRTVILPKDQPDGTIGCGPFMLETLSPYNIKLSTFDRYFNKRPFIDGIEFIFDSNNTNFGISYKPYSHNTPQNELPVQQVGTVYVVCNMQNGPLQNNQLRETIYKLIDSNDFIVDTITETPASNNKDESFPCSLTCIKHTFLFLKIGYQYLSASEQYLDKAIILQNKLQQFGIKTELQCVDIQKEESVDSSIDLFIGGATFGKQKILSILNTYFTKPHALLSFLDNNHRSKVSNILERLYTTKQFSTDEAMLELIEQTQKVHCLKFLIHHKKRMYIREDSRYKNLKFDRDGFIDYHKIYFHNV